MGSSSATRRKKRAAAAALLNYEDLLKALSNGSINHSALTTSIAHHVTSMSRSICADFKTLNDIVLRAEDIIASHWLEMSSEQRRQMLLTVYPDIPHTHNADLELHGDITRRAVDDLGQVAKTLDPMRWPYLNTEDLLKPGAFTMYINARSRTPPWDFALSELHHSSHHASSFQTVQDINDWFSAAMNMSDAQFKERRLEAYVRHPERIMPAFVIRFSESLDPKTYSAFINPKWPPLGLNLDMHSDDVPVWLGLQILRCQQQIYSFLLGCCRHICSVYKVEISATISVQTRSTIRLSEFSQDVTPCFATAAAIAPYRSSTDIEVSSLIEYVEAMLNDGHDHITALQQDPEYFDQHIRTVWEHQEQSQPDDCGQYPLECRTPTFLERIIKLTITEAFELVDMWRELHVQLSSLEEARVVDCNSSKVLERILNIEALTAAMLDTLTLITHAKWLTSPTARGSFSQSYTLDCVPTHVMAQVNEDPSIAYGSATLVKIFSQALSPAAKVSRTFVDLYKTLNHVDTLMRKDVLARDLVSSYTASFVSQLTIVAECHRQVIMYKGSPDIRMRLKSHHVIYDTPKYAGRAASRYAFFEAYQIPEHLLPCRYYKLTTAVCSGVGPPDAYLEQLELTSETTAFELWKDIEVTYRKISGTALRSQTKAPIRRRIKPVSPPVKVHSSELIKPAHTPVCAEPEAISKKLKQTALEFSPSIATTAELNSLAAQPPSPIVHAKEERIKGAKVKSKGNTPSTGQHAIRSAPESLPSTFSTAEAKKPVFHLKERDYTVFRSLFHFSGSKSSGSAKAVKWKDLLRAMTNIGFSAEKLMGSAWQFYPRDTLQGMGLKGKVQIHEPHPEKELRATEARKFGRKLAGLYGWDGGMFELA